MDRGEVKRVVDEHIGPLLQRLGIAHWRVDVRYEPRGTDEHGWVRPACVSVDEDYDQAFVTLNPEAFDTEEEAVRMLRHELFHVVLAPYDVFYGAVLPAFADNPVAARMLDSAWTRAIEQAAICLERMHRGLTVAPPDETKQPRKGK